MKLVEKKCPNCGANLSFGENEKSCKCDYCKREFEIERDTDNLDKISLIYNDISKGVGTGFKYIFIVYGIFLFIVAFIISIISFSVFHAHEDNASILENGEANVTYLSSINDISNFDYTFIDTNSSIAISREDTSTFYFHLNSSKRVVLYLLSNDEGNRLIPIYKNVYTNGTITYELYIPVIYENIKVDHGSIAHDVSNARVEAPKYYLNLEKTEYVVGYENLNSLYDSLIKQYEKEYTITKK